MPEQLQDYLKTLRHASATLTRTLDRLQFDFEETTTADLRERVDCILALNELEKDDADTVPVPTKRLRERLRLLDAIKAINRDISYVVERMGNAALKKRIELLKALNAVGDGKDTDELEHLSDDQLANIAEQVSVLVRRRKSEAKRAERAEEAKREQEAEAA